MKSYEAFFYHTVCAQTWKTKVMNLFFPATSVAKESLQRYLLHASCFLSHWVVYMWPENIKYHFHFAINSKLILFQ